MKSSEFLIKICGITNEADARAAIDAGATSLGINGWSQSKRYLELNPPPEWVARFAPELPHGFGVVLVNPTEEEALAACIPGVKFLQLHGDETPQFLARLRQLVPEGIHLVKALRVQGVDIIPIIKSFSDTGVEVFLLDAFSPNDYGGTGKTFDWDLAQAVIDSFPNYRIILSGGLTPDNVEQAVKRLHPAGVDVASGVEETKNPRKKSVKKMKNFAARAIYGESMNH